MSVGIQAWGHYLPRLRMPRSVIAEQLAWFDPALQRAAKGERRFGNWDEDALTMGVAAADAALSGVDADIGRLVFATTTAPFQDRSNAGLMAEALSLPPQTRTQDAGGSQRAATSALLDALESEAAAGCTLISAADRRAAQPGSLAELSNGDAAAAVIVGNGAGRARYLAGLSRGSDFVDHYRTREQASDYVLEDRWIRDAGFMTIVPEAVRAAIGIAGREPGDIDALIVPVPPHYSGRLAKELKLPPSAVSDTLNHIIGATGVGQPLLMLAHALENATAGDLLCVIGFGQGCDVLLFEVTEEIAKPRPGARLAEAVEDGIVVDEYLKLPVFSQQLRLATGIRGEADKRTSMSAYYRHHRALNAMLGSQCQACETPHFPPARVCVACGAIDQMRDYPFASRRARLKSFTEDWLSASPSPPSCYGNVEFDGGGNAFLEITDVVPGELRVGARLAMAFRIKDFDTARGFRRYFWKPVPVADDA